MAGRGVVQFNDQHIELARRLRDAGLAWQPTVGHFVYDEKGLIEVPSPFQEKVYFILDIKHFLRRAGSMECLKEAMFWLPTWSEARQVARAIGVDDAEVAAHLQAEQAIESASELEQLYVLLERELKNRAAK
jgi:hypothetical protein